MTTPPPAQGNVIDVLLVLTRADQVLLALRHGTGAFDGQWNVPSGKLEAGEDVLTGMLRETREEIGLALPRKDLRLAAVTHRRYPGHPARLGLFFHARHDPDRHGEPVNAEPHKCKEIRWYPLDGLPANTVPYTAAGVAAYRTGTPLVLDGWG